MKKQQFKDVNVVVRHEEGQKFEPNKQYDARITRDEYNNIDATLKQQKKRKHTLAIFKGNVIKSSQWNDKRICIRTEFKPEDFKRIVDMGPDEFAAALNYVRVYLKEAGYAI